MLTRRRFLTGLLSLPIATELSGCLSKNDVHDNEIYQTWDFLKPGDIIDVIAPSSPVDDPEIRYQAIQNYFAKTPFKVRIPNNMIEPTTPLEEANTIEKRVSFIHDALNSDAKAIWAIGGGGWGTSLLDALVQLPKPKKVKPILGYSDITALHVYANHYLGIPSIHSVVLGINGDIHPGWNKNGLGTSLDILSGNSSAVNYHFTPINQKARDLEDITTKIVGGNTLIISALNGTSNYTLDTHGKFIFLESIADLPGQFSRKLMGLTFSGVIDNCSGIIFGDIIMAGGKPNPPEIQLQFDYIIQRFGDEFASNKIVMKAENLFGHGPVNLPLPLNTLSHFVKDGNRIYGTISANLV